MSFVFQPLLPASAALLTNGPTNTLAAEAGAATFAGQSIMALQSRRLAAVFGTINIGGQNTALLRSISVSAGQANFALSGHQAQLLSGIVFNADAGLFNVNGQPAGLNAMRLLDAAAATAAFTGQAVQISDPVRIFTVNEAQLTASGQTLDLIANRFAAAGNASLGLSGRDVNFIIITGNNSPRSSLGFAISFSL